MKSLKFGLRQIANNSEKKNFLTLRQPFLKSNGLTYIHIEYWYRDYENSKIPRPFPEVYNETIRLNKKKLQGELIRLT